jgi:hypothetical protein
MEEPTLADIVQVFEDCWERFTQEYRTKRLLNLYCSEADIRFHFASELLKGLNPPTCVYVEFPIPFETMDFLRERDTLGKARRKMRKGEGMIPDIVVMDCNGLVPYVMVELKYSPLIWNYYPVVQAAKGELKEERKETVRNLVIRTIDNLKLWEKRGPSQVEVVSYFKNFDKTLRLIQDFRELDESTYVYLCVIDEIFPNLGQLLEEEAKKQSFPHEFRVRFHHNSMRSWLEEQLRKI